MAGSNWWVTSAPMSMPGGTVQSGGGGSLGGSPGYTGDSGFYRSRLDAIRAGDNQGPTAQYPDGYLGTIIDRREGRLIGAVQKRLTDKSYQRGVHKGEKIGASSYFWDQDMDPEKGLNREAVTATQTGNTISVERFAPTGNPVEKLTAMGNTAALSINEQMKVANQYGVDYGKNPMPMMQSDPNRAKNLQKVLPRWSGVYRAA